jgi:hypothetical protein
MVDAAAATVTGRGGVLTFWRHVCLSLAISAIVMIVSFPDLYARLNYSLIRFQDTEFLYFGLFQLVQDMVHGRVQLWNHYDEMPLAYFYLTGMMTYAHVLAAAFFVSTQGLFQDTAHYFYAVSVLVFNAIPTVVRTIGLYLLLRLFTRHRPTLLLSTALGSSIFNPQFHLGLNCTPIYSFLPLVMFFVLRFLQTLAGRDLLFGFLVITACVASNPLVGLGYFYQGVHFFLVTSLVWYVVSQPGNDKLAATLRRFSALLTARRFYIALGMTLALAGAIMLPWIWLLLSTYFDYELAHATSRFAEPFTVLGYFHKAHFAANPWLFFTKQLDYSNNEWVVQWVFVGWTCIFFVLCGLVLSPDSRKYIFAGAIFLFWLIQFPRNPLSPFGAAHWINALTNPFSSVLRSAHMTGAFLLPTMMLPLFAMGVDRMRCLLLDPTERVEAKRIWLLVLAVAAVIVCALAPARSWGLKLSASAVLYIVAPGLLAMLVLGSLVVLEHRRTAAVRLCMASVFVVIFLGDLWASHKYFSQMGDKMGMMAHEIEGIPPSVNPVGIDFQNPLITPVREHYTNRHIGQVKPFFITDPNNMQGIFYRYTNLEKFFAAPNNYKPRHASYAVLASDATLQEYVRRDNRISFVADAAIPYGPGVLRTLLAEGLDRRLVAVDADGLASVTDPEAMRRLIGAAPIATDQVLVAALRFRDARLMDVQAGLRRYAVDLPAGFPRTLASGVFTDDRGFLSVRVGQAELAPAQGWLIRPLQYDLQNIRAGTLQFSLAPGPEAAEDLPIEVRYRSTTPMNPISMTRMEPDRFDFRVDLSRAGWLVLHQPYDANWHTTVNGRPQRAYRANGAFVAFPLSAGRSLVSMEYKDASPLRYLIPLSIILNFGVLIAAMIMAYRSLETLPERRV